LGEPLMLRRLTEDRIEPGAILPPRPSVGFDRDQFERPHLQPACSIAFFP